VEARLSAKALAAYPGQTPVDLATAYATQDAAIELWPDDIAGWKIGLIQPEHRAAFAQERIAGPIFKSQVQRARAGETVDLPVFDGGFAAVEAEFVVRLNRDTPTEERAWTAEEAAHYAGAMYIGIELAGSPFREINDHGPAVTASDFGNNAGLVLGAEIANWRDQPLEALKAAMHIDGAQVGVGSAALIPGGPFAALAFIIEHCARRGKRLREGQLISTGATTGVHQIKAGQVARVDFGTFGEISCRAVAASPQRARR
jgi:2-keto-4-pentenoate hydratase